MSETCIPIRNIQAAKEIENFGESYLATHFFSSILIQNGFRMDYQPGTFFARKLSGKRKGRLECTVPDFKFWHPNTKLYPRTVLTEVTESETLHNKSKQRRVMRANSTDRLAYVQFPWEALIRPEWCFSLIEQMAKGKVDTEQALGIVSIALLNGNFNSLEAILSQYAN